MPKVRKAKSWAKDYYDGAGKGRERRANTPCSRFVLFVAGFSVAAWGVTVDLQTVICQVPSGSRESVAAAKLQQPAYASRTLRWRPFNQA
jgi:hypothetical protein